MNVQRRRSPVIVASPEEEPPQGMTDAGASELAAAIAKVAPALEDIAKFAGNLDARLDALCKWLRSAKPYAIAFAVWLVTQYFPEVAEHVAPLLQSAIPQ